MSGRSSVQSAPSESNKVEAHRLTTWFVEDLIGNGLRDSVKGEVKEFVEGLIESLVKA